MKKYYSKTMCVCLVVFFATAMPFAVFGDDAGISDHGLKGVAEEGQEFVSNILQLTKNPLSDEAQCWGAWPWSSDGEWIVYQSFRPGSGSPGEDRASIAAAGQIAMVKADGSDWRQVTNLEGCASHPSFVPPSDQQIVFQWNDGGGDANIALINEDGTNAAKLTETGGDTDIWLINADGTNAANLTDGDEFPPCPDCGDEFGSSKPVVSPDGTKIAYHSQSYIWVMNAVRPPALREPVMISSHASNRHTWSPDSQWVLYDSVWGYYDTTMEETRSGEKCEGSLHKHNVELNKDLENNPVGRKIVKSKPDGSETVVLTDDDLNIYDAEGNLIDTASNTYDDGSCAGWAAKGENWASYSSDGKWIAYHARYGVVKPMAAAATTDERILQYYENKFEYSTLSIMKPDGTGKKNLVVKGPNYDDGGPYSEYTWICGPKSWSPDGKWIAFKMSKSTGQALAAPERETSDEPTEIFAIHVDTLRVVKLTEGYDDYRMWYSPDGLKILFKDGSEGYTGASRDDGQYGTDLLVINLKEETPLEGDGDGVGDFVEMGPNGNDENYDADNNGNPDYKDNHVASLPVYDNSAYTSLILDHAQGEEFTVVRAVGNPSPGDTPEGLEFPFGFFEFNIDNVVDCTTITIVLPYNAKIATYWKFGPTQNAPGGEWYPFMYDPATGVGAVIQHSNPDSTTITLHLCDGSLGDDDLAKNGTIIDQGGPAYSTVAIPTVSEWGLILAALILGLAGTVRINRRRGKLA